MNFAAHLWMTILATAFLGVHIGVALFDEDDDDGTPESLDIGVGGSAEACTE